MARILVADDSDFMRTALRGVLRQKNHEVLEASDGVEAVSNYRKERPDLVTMDITMPNKDGIDAAREILQEDRSAKIIMVTALGQQSVMRKAIEMGILEFIVKPFTPEKVWEVVDRVLKEEELS
ncbi:MAG: response regulator [bacterium]